jgi:hypothetical protein
MDTYDKMAKRIQRKQEAEAKDAPKATVQVQLPCGLRVLNGGKCETCSDKPGAVHPGMCRTVNSGILSMRYCIQLPCGAYKERACHYDKHLAQCKTCSDAYCCAWCSQHVDDQGPRPTTVHILFCGSVVHKGECCDKHRKSCEECKRCVIRDIVQPEAVDEDEETGLQVVRISSCFEETQAPEEQGATDPEAKEEPKKPGLCAHCHAPITADIDGFNMSCGVKVHKVDCFGLHTGSCDTCLHDNAQPEDGKCYRCNPVEYIGAAMCSKCSASYLERHGNCVHCNKSISEDLKAGRCRGWNQLPCERSSHLGQCYSLHRKQCAVCATDPLPDDETRPDADPKEHAEQDWEEDPPKEQTQQAL